ncbi:MAG: lipopolysaccharide biosynthesis protein [Bacteroides sp.]|nr:lipopolysaccharide biosynthesis protein [Roseburia sp.]MCM1346415.1 lipopolysaccharide biosynthesis protein [Bacteroides sp.]MCM1420983.1 lipopolysaccharide biosynthesis protein [Bacteroides sp.]
MSTSPDRQKESALKEKAAKGFFWGGVSNGIMQILNALFGIIIARCICQEDYGLVGELAIFSAIASALQEGGFISALTNRKNATYKDFNSAFWFNVTCSALMYTILWFCAPLLVRFFNEPRLLWLSRYSFLGFFIASLSITPRAILFKKLMAKEQAIMTLAAMVPSGTVGVIMAVNGMAYWGVATQTIMYVSGVTVLSWWFSHWKPSRDVSFKPIKEMFGFGSKMLITNIFNCINNNIFSFIFGRFYTAMEVGTYTQANKWNLMGSQTITGMVQSVAQPTFVQVGNDRDALCRSFRKMLRFTSFVCFPTMFGIILIAPEFIVITITEKWLPSARMMQELCIAGAFIPITVLYYNFIISRGKSHIYMWNIMTQCVVVLLTACLIKICGLSVWNISGIHLMVNAYIVICVTWVGIWHYFLWREIHLSPFAVIKDIAPFLLIATATMATTYFLTAAISNIYLLLVTRVLTAAVLYLAILRLTGAKILKECLYYLKKKKEK